MTPGTLLQEVSRFAAGLRDGDVRPEILQDGRRQITDIVGIALAASQMELTRVFFKPYPANHFTHAGIDAAIRLREEGLDIEQVEEIELGIASPALRTIAQSEGEKAKPETGYAAQFSGPFTVATVLVGDQGLGVSLDDFTAEDVKDPVKLDLAPCVASPTRSATASSRTSFRLSCASG